MAQIVFVKQKLSSLYRVEGSGVYARLPVSGRRDVLTAPEILEAGGMLIYLRENREGLEECILQAAAAVSKQVNLLFLTNRGKLYRHWGVTGWCIQGGVFERGGPLEAGGYLLMPQEGGAVSCGEEGLSLTGLSFGRGSCQRCGDVRFLWEGAFCFLMEAGRDLLQEAALAYGRQAYDVLTRRRIEVLDVTAVPVVYAPSAAASVSMARGKIFWDRERESLFTLPRGSGLVLGGLEVSTTELALPVLEGREHSFLGLRARGSVSRKLRLPMDGRGELRAECEDGVELAEECREPGNPVTLRMHAPFYAGGISMECSQALPLPPADGWRSGGSAAELLRRRLQSGCTFAHSRNLWCEDAPFSAMLYRGKMHWFNIRGGSSTKPGIALCDPDQALAVTLAWERCFVVLDAGCTDRFGVPYTMDDERLQRAVALGYSAKEARWLKDCYPAGCTFLGWESFCRAVKMAGCACDEALTEACHHFQIQTEGRWLSFLPERWDAQGTVLVLKRGREKTLSALIAKEQAWDISPEDAEEAGKALAWAEKQALHTPAEAAFLQREWEGAVVVQGTPGGEKKAAVLILPAKQEQQEIIIE